MFNYQARLKNLSERLKAVPCEALLVENPTNILYLTGLEISSGKLLITLQDSFLIVDGRYIELARQNAPCIVLLSDQMTLKEWIISRSILSLAFESDKTSYSTYVNLQKIAMELSVILIPVESPVQSMRLIKDRDEQNLMREAARMAYTGFEFVSSHLRAGITETEMALELEIFWKKMGAKKLSFDPIIAFGANGSMPHYRAGMTPLQDGMPVLIDIGVTWKNYQSDMTRVVFFGEPSLQIKEIYTIVEEAKKLATKMCKPGTLVGELDKAARDFITSKGYGKNFTHSLGHGIGLETHEPPTIRSKGTYNDLPLQAGMTITIEPGIYLPGIGGVRLEDTILITYDGYENLTVY